MSERDQQVTWITDLDGDLVNLNYIKQFFVTEPDENGQSCLVGREDGLDDEGNPIDHFFFEGTQAQCQVKRINLGIMLEAITL